MYWPLLRYPCFLIQHSCGVWLLPSAGRGEPAQPRGGAAAAPSGGPPAAAAEATAAAAAASGAAGAGVGECRRV